MKLPRRNFLHLAGASPLRALDCARFRRCFSRGRIVVVNLGYGMTGRPPNKRISAGLRQRPSVHFRTKMLRREKC